MNGRETPDHVAAGHGGHLGPVWLMPIEAGVVTGYVGSEWRSVAPDISPFLQGAWGMCQRLQLQTSFFPSAPLRGK